MPSFNPINDDRARGSGGTVDAAASKAAEVTPREGSNPSFPMTKPACPRGFGATIAAGYRSVAVRCKNLAIRPLRCRSNTYGAETHAVHCISHALRPSQVLRTTARNPRGTVRLMMVAAFAAGVLASPTAAPTAQPCTRWILTHEALLLLARTFGSDEARRVFGSPCTYLVGSIAPAFSDWGMTPTMSAGDARAVRALALRAHAIIYDPEAWTFTPAGQQRDPVHAIARAAAVAHAAGAILIATPAVDLMRVLHPNERRYEAFLQAGIIGGAARYADVVELQAQGGEANVRTFAAFVRAAARQTRAANPRVIVLAGISTNPSGLRVTARQLAAAAVSVRDVVDGFWLNVPSGGPHCPRCGVPHPQVAAQLLHDFIP